MWIIPLSSNVLPRCNVRSVQHPFERQWTERKEKSRTALVEQLFLFCKVTVFSGIWSPAYKVRPHSGRHIKKKKGEKRNKEKLQHVKKKKEEKRNKEKCQEVCSSILYLFKRRLRRIITLRDIQFGHFSLFIRRKVVVTGHLFTFGAQGYETFTLRHLMSKWASVCGITVSLNSYGFLISYIKTTIGLWELLLIISK